MTKEDCPKCGGSSLTKDHGHNTCDDCGYNFAAATGTLENFTKKKSVPKPSKSIPKPKKVTKLPKRKVSKESAPLSQMHLYEGESGGFIHLFQMYSDFLTDASLDYSFWNAVLILGHALGYNTIHLIQPGEVRHNIFLIIILNYSQIL